ncbi:MAG: branched-chain amino acid ABC transporter permease [Burkholderiaceae bacterium]
MRINEARGAAVMMSVLVTLAVYYFISRTTLGKTLRAAADNPEAATYMGIDVQRSHRISFAVGAAITAVAGGLVATYYPFQPYVGLEFVVIMYAGVVLGGLGSIMGAFWGGLIIGVVQQMSTLVLPMQLQNGMIFVLFLAVILFRPQGLFGKNVERA